ncbi:hypothetical protein EMIHUDRAFT_232122 [Emiliania huxleyi CCMP1516]|uniref:SGNH hydrolase-type esterase domain-containing protein n=2 Tax=Emiliania huxleyi TaxID=2903 RepID=A0A0D3K6E2_EMIH1|nr:hypothetical protein EMIHUDRAFT_232122 [Emiliania huxleyi CCMP1516]EOD31327.1 hypothetical protein EMIHUDRAFT_232122 [Emiliania huxleyi CCMP1516]|eukprot:XP_005783756.1 hypothetical protein EMIHUDRAFT_232122 [Emiliania huxleyi CCMP1516]
MALRLLALGDSITDGGVKARAWRYHLHASLSREGRSVRWLGSMLGVYDRKIGELCKFLAARRNATAGAPLGSEADWPRQGKWQGLRCCLGTIGSLSAPPHAALLHIGTNDLTKRVLREGARVASVTTQLSAVPPHASPLCLGVSVASATVLLALPIPHCRGGEAAQRRRRGVEADYHARLEGIAARQSEMLRRKPPTACPVARLRVVNMSTAVTCRMLIDGIHPDRRGAAHMAAAWMEGMRTDGLLELNIHINSWPAQ